MSRRAACARALPAHGRPFPRRLGRRAGADADRRIAPAGSWRSRPRSPTRRATWSTPASSPTCAGSTPTSRSTYPTAIRGRCRAAAPRRLRRLPHQGLRPSLRARRRHRAHLLQQPLRRQLAADHPPRALGGAAPEPAGPALPLDRLRRRRGPRLRQPPPSLLEPRGGARVTGSSPGSRSLTAGTTRNPARQQPPEAPHRGPGGGASRRHDPQPPTGGISPRD